MIINALQHTNCREEHSLAHTETGEEEWECGSDGVDDEGFGEGIIESPKCVWYVHAVMYGVDVSCWIVMLVEDQ